MSTENYLLDRPKNITGFFYIDHRRIDWIDLAKGIAILLVIIGHTVMFGSMARNLIFSFVEFSCTLEGSFSACIDTSDSWFSNL